MVPLNLNNNSDQRISTDQVSNLGAFAVPGLMNFFLYVNPLVSQGGSNKLV